MKRIATFFLLMVIMAAGNAQKTIPAKLSLADPEILLNKSKMQKKVAWILLGTGFVSFIVGANISANQMNDLGWWIDPKTDPAGDALMITGLAFMGGSIPFFIAHKVNKKHARLIMGTERVQLTPSFRTSNRMFSAGISITIK